jgi:hypothetical protein
MTITEFMADIDQMLAVATDDMKLDPQQVLNAVLGVASAYTVVRFKDPAAVFTKALQCASNDAMNAAAEMKVKGR